MRRVIALLVTVVLISCAGDSDSFKLNGTAQGFADGTEVFIYSVGADNIPKIIDTLTITGGAFEGTYAKSEEAALNYLNVSGTNNNMVYFPENVDLDVTVYKDSLLASYAVGSKLNDSYTEFSRRVRYFNELKTANVEAFQQARQEQDNIAVQEIQQKNMALVAEEAQLKKDFIANNSNSLFAAMLLAEMLNRREVTAREATVAMNNFAPKIANTKVVGDLKNLLANMSRADVGSVAPDFSAPTPEGDELSLKEAMGEYTIIDFWASWCRPCRMENPNVVNVYNQYHDKGLNIISVSLDRQGHKERWLKAIEDDQMDWYHVSNLKFWSDPIAKAYNVRSIPATFLLDKDGNIIAKNLRGPALGQKMASLLGSTP